MYVSGVCDLEGSMISIPVSQVEDSSPPVTRLQVLLEVLRRVLLESVGDALFAEARSVLYIAAVWIEICLGE